MYIGPPPSAASTVAEIIAYETAQGSEAWIGPQGAADAWLVLQDYQTKTLPAIVAGRNALALALNKLG